jgi:hypothetical protein
LGLSLCKKLAEFLGGSIDITSSPGVGSTFFVKLPIVYAPDEENSLEKSAAKGDEIPQAGANSPSSAPDSAAKVFSGEDEDSFSVFAEKLVNTNSLYCDRGSQES